MCKRIISVPNAINIGRIDALNVIMQYTIERCVKSSDNEAQVSLIYSGTDRRLARERAVSLLKKDPKIKVIELIMTNVPNYTGRCPSIVYIRLVDVLNSNSR